MRLTRFPVIGLVATTAIFAICTWIAGWWSVPVVAAVIAALFCRVEGEGPTPGDVALTAVLGWAALLAIGARASGFGALLAALGGILRVGSIGVVLVTLAFAALLAWSAAAVVAGILARRTVLVRTPASDRYLDGRGTRRERERVAGR